MSKKRELKCLKSGGQILWLDPYDCPKNGFTVLQKVWCYSWFYPTQFWNIFRQQNWEMPKIFKNNQIFQSLPKTVKISWSTGFDFFGVLFVQNHYPIMGFPYIQLKLDFKSHLCFCSFGVQCSFGVHTPVHL